MKAISIIIVGFAFMLGIVVQRISSHDEAESSSKEMHLRAHSAHQASLLSKRQAPAESETAVPSNILTKLRFDVIKEDQLTEAAVHILKLSDEDVALIETQLAKKSATNEALNVNRERAARVVERTEDRIVWEVPSAKEEEARVSAMCWDAVVSQIGESRTRRILGERPLHHPHHIFRDELTWTPTGFLRHGRIEFDGREFSPNRSHTNFNGLSPALQEIVAAELDLQD